MKNLCFFLFGLLMFSCGQNNSTVMKPKIDTILVSCRQIDNQVFLDSAIRTVYSKRTFKDSSSLQGILSTDTSYRLMQAVDTLRDSLHKPIFDANHNPRYRFAYSPSAVLDSLNRYISPIDLPYHPKP